MDPRHEARKAVKMASIRKLEKDSQYMQLSAQKNMLERQQDQIKLLWLNVIDEMEERGVALLNERLYNISVAHELLPAEYPEKEDFKIVGLNQEDFNRRK